jgi:hypothetical protein
MEGWTEKDIIFKGTERKISGFAGSQAVSASPSGRGTLREGKALRSETGKDLRYGHSYEQGRGVERGFTTNFDIEVGRAALGRSFHVTIGKAACEACCATWNLCTNSVFTLGPRKTTGNPDRFGRQLAPPDPNCQSQSQSYFTTDGLPPISLSWHQAP